MDESKNAAAQALRAIPSELRSQTSRENGKKGGRKRRCSECKTEIKPGDSWERHSYKKSRYLYCGNCAERIRQEQRETDRMEDRRYP
jgi:DNA-directed RNA polymerase subunit RPC12/RpoP